MTLALMDYTCPEQSRTLLCPSGFPHSFIILEQLQSEGKIGQIRENLYSD
uniref:Uncharacterized protein n=1 Tax=Anguilla anguilla TaxID=7936 RepID=A0A0E9WPL4_ANGAN